MYEGTTTILTTWRRGHQSLFAISSTTPQGPISIHPTMLQIALSTHQSIVLRTLLRSGAGWPEIVKEHSFVAEPAHSTATKMNQTFFFSQLTAIDVSRSSMLWCYNSSNEAILSGEKDVLGGCMSRTSSTKVKQKHSKSFSSLFELHPILLCTKTRLEWNI